MEQTFITIHNLSHDANIIFASDSIVDTLGYQPQEVQGISCFGFFHPDEVSSARLIHSRGVLLDKVAVLHYVRVLSRDGRWVSCECCFTIVHDVLVACTSIYHRGRKSQRRAIEAPQIRRMFSCSLRDPRYHMLEHMSPKFKLQPTEREPRAALILNRFTRALTIMFATNAVYSILGIGPDELRGKSLYDFIADSCWSDAVECIESAKSNDSIAYLRFWSRHPEMEDERDVEMEDRTGEMSEDVLDGEEPPNSNMGISMDNGPESPVKREPRSPLWKHHPILTDGLGAQTAPSAAQASQMPTTSSSNPRRPTAQQRRQIHGREPNPSCELEAVISGTSDGLLMVLRKARPPIPPSLHSMMLPESSGRGLAATPWNEPPVSPEYRTGTFLNPQTAPQPHHISSQARTKEACERPSDHLIRSIKDVTVSTWGLVGINEETASYSRGEPKAKTKSPNSHPSIGSNGPPFLKSEPSTSNCLASKPPKANSSERGLPAYSHPVSSTITLGEQSHTRMTSQFNGMGVGHINGTISQNTSAIMYSPRGQAACSRIQQRSHYTMTGYPDGIPQN